jgi:hypothetical protein
MERLEKIFRILVCIAGCFTLLQILSTTESNARVMTYEENLEFEHQLYFQQHPEALEDEVEDTIKRDTIYIKKKVSMPSSQLKREQEKFMDAVVTVYHPTVKQCGSNPLQPADPNVKIDKKKLKHGELRNWVAVSPDIVRSLNLQFGDKLEIYCEEDVNLNGIYEYHDHTHKKLKKRVDILMHEDNKTSGFWKVKIRKV